MKRLFIIMAVILTIIPVFTNATPYKPFGFIGGYSETRLSDDSYRVRYRTGTAGLKELSGYVLFRSAELTLLNGYDFFVIGCRDSMTFPYYNFTVAYGTIRMTNTKTMDDGFYEAKKVIEKFVKEDNFRPRDIKKITPPPPGDGIISSGKLGCLAPKTDSPT